jgi:hypothetical protein
MKQTLFIGILAGVLAAGCSKEEELTIAEPASPSVSAVDPMATPTANANAAQTPEVFDPSKLGPPPPPIADFSSNARPLDNDGRAMDDLAYLNNVLFNYNESRGTYSTDVIPNFKNDAERQAYDEALRKLKEPITDLNELVRAKVIKAIPAAPAGKKYTVNKKTLKVELVDATAP